MIGYGFQVVDDVNLLAGQTRTVDFRLGQEAIAIDAIEVFATRAIERRTPVAFTDVPKVQIQNQLGSRDLPMVLNVTPSVYATAQGGGAGDARINVRGFSQRNTAVMINGVPVNDMENGWVYWSNWDGLGDAATSIQLQRGLSAVNLAAPSIGGTLNVITDPTSVNAGFSYKQEFGLGNLDADGSWGAGRNLLKETFVLNTGEHAGFALTASVVRKTGDGMYQGFWGGDATWTDAWAYYMAARYQLNARNRVELYAVGAPQRHGQNLYKLNIGTLSQEFAQGLDDYDAGALADFPEAGRRGSPNVSPVDPSYTGQQYSSTGPGGGSPQDRYSENYINERENYFHKPQVNLNWYSYLGSGLTLTTVGYYSGGNGGGTGTYGSSRNTSFWYNYTQRVPDWNGTIAKNRARGPAGSGYILRNSVNNQWTIGAISKLRKEYEGGSRAAGQARWASTGARRASTTTGRSVTSWAERTTTRRSRVPTSGAPVRSLVASATRSTTTTPTRSTGSAPTFRPRRPTPTARSTACSVGRRTSTTTPITSRPTRRIPRRSSSCPAVGSAVSSSREASRGT
jgi:hypothetical protein